MHERSQQMHEGDARRRARAVLGVSHAATATEIDRAFRRLARRWHPDHGGDVEQFRRLVAARATLTSSVPAGVPTPVMFVRTPPWWRRLLALIVRPPPRAPRVQ